MKTLSIHNVRNVLAVLVVGALFGATYFANLSVFKAQEAKAISTANMSGWAWANTPQSSGTPTTGANQGIGWISFNSLGCDQDKNQYVDIFCGGTTALGAPNNGSNIPVTDYGVSVGTANKSAGGTDFFSGQAWGENIGWVSFNSADTAYCGTTYGGGAAQINWGTGKTSGWARALSGTPSAGNWDGCIKLSGMTNEATPQPYGVTFSGNTFSGWAWGSDTLGWIDFAPTVNGSRLYGVSLGVPPCTSSDVPTTSWGACQPLATCTPGTTTSNVSGVQVGACSTGGTVTQPCTIATLVCPVASGSTTATSTKFWQF